MRRHRREALEESGVDRRRDPRVEAGLGLRARRRHRADLAPAVAAGDRRLLRLRRRRRRGLHRPGGAEAGQRRRRRGSR